MEPFPWLSRLNVQPPDDSGSSPETVQTATPNANAGLVVWSLVSAFIIVLEYISTNGFEYISPVNIELTITLTLVLTAPIFAIVLVFENIDGSILFLAMFFLLGFSFVLAWLIPDSGAGLMVGLGIFVFMIYGFVLALLVALCKIVGAIGRCL